MLTYRNAHEIDVFPLMELYQKATGTTSKDPLFLDYQKLLTALLSGESQWFVTEESGEIVAAISCLVDEHQKMAKISRMLVDRSQKNRKDVLRKSLRNALDRMKIDLPTLEVVFTTTLSMTMDLQEVTLLEGFKIMGVFPNATGSENSQLNGLTVYYYDEVFHQRRQSRFRLHEAIVPFFEVAQKQLDLPPVDVSKPEETTVVPGEEAVPPLEIIKAPLLVGRKFKGVKARPSQVINFYPFYSPNTLISDAEQKVEIYVRVADNIRFAAIIGENLELSVNPVELYNSVAQILKNSGVSYVEIINDAADVYGTQCFLDANFTPCAYIPAFKRQGETRRDYVVFGRSFEYLSRPDLNVDQEYIEFFKQYYKIEKSNYFREI